MGRMPVLVVVVAAFLDNCGCVQFRVASLFSGKIMLTNWKD